MSSVIKVCEPGFEENPDIQKIFRNHINDDLSVYLTKIGLLKRDLKSKQWSIAKINLLLNKKNYKRKIKSLLNKDLNNENLISEEEIYLPNSTNNITWALYTCLSILHMKINKIVNNEVNEVSHNIHEKIRKKIPKRSAATPKKISTECTDSHLKKLIILEIDNFEKKFNNIKETKEHYIRYISFVTDFIKETLDKIKNNPVFDRTMSISTP